MIENVKRFYQKKYCKQQTEVEFWGVGGGGWGLEPPLCGKCDVIFSYIYTNTIELVFIYPI